MNIKDLLEAAYQQSGHLGQLTHTFPVPIKEDAYRINSFIHSPKTGWHSRVEPGADGEWHVTITVNVDSKNLT